MGHDTEEPQDAADIRARAREALAREAPPTALVAVTLRLPADVVEDLDLLARLRKRQAVEPNSKQGIVAELLRRELPGALRESIG